MFLRITPTALKEYSPVLIELKNKKETKKKRREEILTVEVICVPSWGERFSPYQISLLSYVLARLEMRHTRVLGAGSQPILT